ncbi:malto-oligosyltrehalose synthase [Marinobacter changyiensis]|uniref:malto-oligosyltrehalose synthase n=1 Tax=Marinobacter changyiensis TaxID=2604091 RepID=UPI001C555EE4|nr:malto-oligosyltrehalose synthase [Marinobacter changyiensis]
MNRNHEMPFGARLQPDGKVRFGFWAPALSEVELCLHEAENRTCLPMEPRGEGWFCLETDRAGAGSLYSYRVRAAESVPDPASRFQPEDVHGPSEVIDPSAFAWEDGEWRGRPWHEAVIYELHTGTFSKGGDYQGIEERLDYLAELGVTAIELMPLSDFPGSRNWGYDGVLPFAPDHTYGRPEQLKSLIQAAHKRQIMIFLDVVYNHFGPDGNYLHLYAPVFFTEHHQTPWGAAINFDDENSQTVRDFFIHSALYWLEEYHLDGLRLDAVHAIHDDSSPCFLEELATRVHEGPGRNRQIHLVLENDCNSARYLARTPELSPRFYNAQWNDDIHHCLHLMLTGESDGYYADYTQKPNWFLGRCLAEGFAYQGEPSPYRGNARRGESSTELPSEAFVSFLQNHDQVGNRAFGERIDALAPAAAISAAAAVRLLAPQPPLLFMGEEFGATTPFQFFCDFSGELAEAVTSGRQAEFSRFEDFSEAGKKDRIPDPNSEQSFLQSKLAWDCLESPYHADRHRHFRDLLAVRRQIYSEKGHQPLPGAGTFHASGDTAVKVTWQLRDGYILTMLANLGPHLCPIPGRGPDPGDRVYYLPAKLPDALKNGNLLPWSVAVFIASARDANAIPTATYRIQLNRDFSFRDATDLIPYLHDLGISHCYCSPYLKARSGSSHGYDIVDHGSLNPEIGSQADFDDFVAKLRALGMGHILDMVPNHMGVMGDDNLWWLDVLENGPASQFGHFFDIDWTPLRRGMNNQVLIPVLGDHYGDVLDKTQLKLAFDQHEGTFSVHYYEHRFPIDPRQYPRILNRQPGKLKERFGCEEPTLMEFQSLMTALENLPPRSSTLEEELTARNRDKEFLKQRLKFLHENSPALQQHLKGVVREINKSEALGSGISSPMHELLEAQAYRLAYWRVAADEINYRRFFDINDLACLRQEEHAVFEKTHSLALALVREGKVQGLRIDHPDGLCDPAQYFHRLQGDRPAYLIAEKILSEGERLRRAWPIHGTTGYEFAADCTGLFIDPDSADEMQSIYEAFVGHRMEFQDICYRSKKLIVQTSLASEMAVLANQLARIADADPHSRDFTLNGLRQALTEVVACFPVYRTYITDHGVTEEDRDQVDRAVQDAMKRSRAADITAFRFIRDALLLELGEGLPEALRRRLIQFSMSFQQYTSPVMAKGLEDTALYVYHRLVALNEVGGKPGVFGISPAAFHQANLERQANWPHSMVDTSTHDTKRSADTRARIGVLSEIPDQWREKVNHWTAINARHKHQDNDSAWPEKNTEYLLYQTLVGAWPMESLPSIDMEAFGARIRDYMLKAVKEAKQHTSWINSNAGYEESLSAFIDAILDPANSEFLEDFTGFQKSVSNLGMYVSLAQLLLKLTAPGVPDTYQGDELWNFNLVDPDNRRPVNYDQRRQTLQELKAQFDGESIDRTALSMLTDDMLDGRIKCYLTWKCLSLRRQHADLFSQGAYIVLRTRGAQADNLFAFAREHEGDTLIVAVPRLLGRLAGATASGSGNIMRRLDWGNSGIELPEQLAARDYRNHLTGESVEVTSFDNSPLLMAEQLFAEFPVALLVSRSPS